MSDATLRRKCLEEEDTSEAPESGASGAATPAEEKKDVVMEEGEGGAACFSNHNHWRYLRPPAALVVQLGRMSMSLVIF